MVKSNSNVTLSRDRTQVCVFLMEADFESLFKRENEQLILLSKRRTCGSILGCLRRRIPASTGHDTDGMRQRPVLVDIYPLDMNFGATF
jgi:hypothetical protein